MCFHKFIFFIVYFVFNATATTEIYTYLHTLSLHDALPIFFFSLLVITVSFLPIFTLEAQEGRLFGPLAFTKTFAMAAAALLSVTLVPALMVVFVRGRIVPEHRNPVNRLLIWIYRPVIRGVLKAKTLTILVALVALGITILPARQLGSEFMPDLDEGTR